MDEKLEYAEQWEVSSKYFYDKNYYNWMQTKIKDYNIILEVGCGTGYSTLSLLENRLRASPWTTAHQAPMSVGSLRQEYRDGLPRPPLGVFPTQGLNPRPPHLWLW